MSAIFRNIHSIDQNQFGVTARPERKNQFRKNGQASEGTKKGERDEGSGGKGRRDERRAKSKEQWIKDLVFSGYVRLNEEPSAR